MGRLFITAEDVRHAEGGEILVDDHTVVTPQALEAAEAAGVVLRQAGGGAYVEPVPDRGPDASTTAPPSVHLPEPAGEPGGEMETGVVIAVVGRNRPGVLAELTNALSGLNADVRDISQRTVEGFFHLVLTVELGQAAAHFGDLKQGLEALGGPDDYVVRVMHERVFRFMHRI